ncbi:AMP-dependent synthetase/ligase [Solemya elarraichensis gill symbiont]|uniref:Long-chain fatty acid--CoA ligase n=1 Tax=Solemya elarraichensis gill symbiont TaxID=1918949 RepID=A0A1T2L1K3_9GAMM|nr:AMP-dependent synthetase/ligase [Solemya elarraichensis gill symbiont]OOZ38975.1 long-chain fatty acid--CoA ligase [Solemya elarraichensis gill symbiont]
MTEDIITVEQATSLDGLFFKRVDRTPDKEALRHFDKSDKSWNSYTWKESLAEIARWQEMLARENLSAGDRVAILLRNCPEWVFFEQAALSLGLVVVPLYTDDRPDNVGYIIEDAGIRLLLIQDAGRWKRLAPSVENENSPLQRVLILESSSEAEKCVRNDDRVHLVENEIPSHGVEYKPRLVSDINSLATIVYTSGTTGRPKGVMLSHFNILSIAHRGMTMISVFVEDIFLSFLPLSHTLERTVGYYVPVMTGATIIYARSVGQLADDLVTHKPTVLIAVPRVFERVYNKIQDQLANGPGIKRKLFNKAVGVGWRKFERDQGRAGWHPSLLTHKVLDKLVGAKIREKLGGRMRLAVAGGAPLPASIGEMFLSLGVPVLQGYGLTETAPIISGNPVEKNKPASVGLPLRGVEVVVGENDELLVKTPGMMLGYWNNHDATSNVIDKDGWLHTGDQGRIDEDGHIYITGRLKDILVLSNGEKIPPAEMESAISMDSMFDQVMVIGEGESYLTALAVVDEAFWTVSAPGKPYTKEALNQKEIVSDALKRIRNALHDFPGYAKVRRVVLLSEPWGIDNGMMTPTLKVKRQSVLEHYVDDVKSMYS